MLSVLVLFLLGAWLLTRVDVRQIRPASVD
jgi:hypothetical protein